MLRILASICIGTIFLLSNVEASQIEELKDAFEGKRPFYAVTVTRTTPYNEQTDYKFLLKHQSYLLFSILENALGGQDHFFIKQLEKVFSEEMKRYEESKLLKLKVSEQISDQESELYKRLNEEIFEECINKDTLFDSLNKNQKIEVFEELKKKETNVLILEKEALFVNIQNKNKLKNRLNYIKNNFPIEIEKKISLILYEGSKEKQQFVEYWEKNENHYKDIVGKHFSLYEEIIEKIKQYKFYDLKNHWGLIVFNEMFFGKSVPIEKGLLDEFVPIKEFSKINPNKIFHINFLLNDIKKFLNQGEKLKYIDQYRGDKKIFNWDEKEKDYNWYLSQFNNEDLILKTLENISFSFLNGIILTSYNKSSYQMENDDDLKNRVFYIFGNRQDSIVSEDSEVSWLLQEHLSTEICYDLECSIRNQFNSYPKKLTIHVVPSNTLPFKERHYLSLPNYGKVVIHADPVEKDFIYERSPVIQAGISNLDNEMQELCIKYSTQKWIPIKENLLNKTFPPIEFVLEGSFYRIKIFDLMEKLQ
jgi:hypothetical protein